jgi:hypothetical protein
LHLDRAVAPPAGFVLDDTTLRGSIDDVAEDLPGLLRRVATAGARVLDVEIEAPSLQAVFLHLTGRELRE